MTEAATRVTAGARYIRMSPYKMREVAALIKGKPIDEARRILAFTPKLASRELSKVLESAIANAEHNFQIPQEELVVKIASADEGMTIKRFRPRAQGRGFRIRKRTCHVNLVLERDPKRAEAIARAAAAAPTTRRRGAGAAASTRKPATTTKTPAKTSAKTSTRKSAKAQAAGPDASPEEEPTKSTTPGETETALEPDANEQAAGEAAAAAESATSEAPSEDQAPQTEKTEGSED